MSKKVGFRMVWKIESFSGCLQKNGEYLLSPGFVVRTVKDIRCQLMLYPKGENGDTAVKLYIKTLTFSAKDFNFILGPLLDEVLMDSNFICELSFLSPDGVAMKRKEYRTWTPQKDVQLPLIVERSEIFGSKKSKFLHQDTLTVRCIIYNINTGLPQPEICFARTRISVEHRSFFWFVKDFSSIKQTKKNTIILEPVSKQLPALTFELRFTDDKRLQIKTCIESAEYQCLLNCKISAMDADGKVYKFTQVEHLFEASINNQVCQFPLFLKRKKLVSNAKLYLPKDVLNLYCECELSLGVISNQIEDFGKAITSDIGNPHCLNTEENSSGDSITMKEDVQNFYEEQKFCDLTLCTESSTFLVHKTVLCARSPVFRAMFENDMKEKANDSVEIPDLKPSTVKSMLHFVYYDEAKIQQWDDASQLYFAADKYGILKLKQICSTFLKSKLSFTNFCNALILSDMHQDDDLKRAVQNFILKHGKEIMKSVEWNYFEKNNMKLANETLREVFLKNLEN